MRKVHRNAELTLAATCEVALKTADRVRKSHQQMTEDSGDERVVEDWDAFSGLMGDRMLFLPHDLGLHAERVVSASAPNVDSVQPDDLGEAAPAENRKDMQRPTQASPDNLYTAGEPILALRRLSGQPSV